MYFVLYINFQNHSKPRSSGHILPDTHPNIFLVRRSLCFMLTFEGLVNQDFWGNIFGNTRHKGNADRYMSQWIYPNALFRRWLYRFRFKYGIVFLIPKWHNCIRQTIKLLILHRKIICTKHLSYRSSSHLFVSLLFHKYKTWQVITNFTIKY